MANQKLTDRLLATGVTLDDLIHIVITGDTTDSPEGSSYKATIEQVATAITQTLTEVYVTGGTYSNGTATFTNNTGGTFNVTGFVTGDTYVTGMTFNVSNYDLTIGRNDGVTFTDSLAILASDLTITGGTYDSNTGIATFTNNTGGTFQVTGFLTGFTDVYVTGGTYSSGVVTFTNSSGGTFNVTGFTQPFSGGSGDCITDLYISNLYGCSPITVWDNLTLSGSVIDSQGGGYLDLRYGGDGKFYLGNDNGAYSDTFINGESGYLEISAYDPNGKVAIYTDGGNAGIELSNSNSLTNDLLVYTNTLSIMSTPNGYPGGQNLFEVLNDNVLLEGNGTVSLTAYPHSGAGLGVSADLLIISNTSGSTFTTNSLRETNSSLLSSQYSTILQGVKNSVGLGGYNLNVNSDNTAFVDNLNIKTIGSGTSVINLGLDVNGNVVTGSTGGSPFTGNTSGDCITDLYISNLYGCSPITIHDNLIFESGVTITSTNGGGQIELDYALQPSNILISTDNGGGTESFINLQQTELNLSSLNGDVRIQSLTSNDFRSGNLFSNKSQILMEPDFVKIGVVDPLASFSNDYESVVVYNTRSSDQTTSNANKWPVIISSKNSTVLSGVRNSVILGGQGITASTNDTVYVDNLNINNVGGGTSVINLGLDVNGNVVTGTTGGNTFTGGSVNGETIFNSGLSATTISATTIGSSTDCVDDIYVSNIHSCSPLNINPLDEGNVYFGSNSGITIDLVNERVGVGTSSPQYPLQILGSNSTFYYDPTSAGGRFNLSGSTRLPRFDLSIASYLTKPATGGSFAMRCWDDTLSPGYGKVGDMAIYAGNETNGLNIINGPGTATEDYIRFYAGQTATGTADIHINGTGSTRGYVGIGTESPTEKLHVNGNVLVSNTLSANTVSISGITVNPKQTIALFFGFDSVNPLDSTTYYIGNQINLAPVTTGQDGRRVLVPKTGFITRVDITQSVGGTLGTNETSTFTINNVTQSTQSTISSIVTYDSSSSINAYDLSSPLSVNNNDKIEIRWVTPVWVTNPTTVRSQINVYLEY